jgi:glycosyltransferase involved in cell wall biosynthesis
VAQPDQGTNDGGTGSFHKLSVIVPVFDERNTVVEIVRRMRAVELPVELEIVIVDDGSTDGTRDVLRQLADSTVHVVMHERNQGKGAAIRTGLASVTGDLVLVQDADLEYDPGDWPTLLEPIIDGRADACFGSRFLGGPHRVLYYWHSVGNRILTTYSNMWTNLNLTDMETCYKAVRGELARSLLPRLTAERFGFEPEITARLARSGARIFEVPISYSGRTYAEGKKIGWRDGVAAFWHITKYNLS